MEKPDAEELKKRIHESLVPSGWGNVLKSFVLSDDMSRILTKLIQESEEGKKWTPKLKQIFRAFTECQYEKLKAVMILQD